MPKNRVALAVLTLKIADPAAREIQLLPAGRFKSVDGRPGTICAATDWICETADAQSVISARSGRSTRMVIDYEHQTLNAERNGQPAPAAGWFSQMEWREGQGLFAVDVKWTKAAASAIAADEYLYISPVFQFDPETGHVQRMLMAALTNNPGVDGMQPVALSATFNPDDADEDIEMNELLKAFLKTLGLDDKADEKTALAALTAYSTAAKADKDRVTALTADVAGRDTQIATMRANSPGAPDPAQYVPIAVVTDMHTRIAALSSQVTGRELDEVVQDALKAGKLLPPQEAWARSLGQSNLAALKSFLETAPAIAALNGNQTNGNAPTGLNNDELDDATMKICRMFGNDPAKVKETMKGNAK